MHQIGEGWSSSGQVTLTDLHIAKMLSGNSVPTLPNKCRQAGGVDVMTEYFVGGSGPPWPRAAVISFVIVAMAMLLGFIALFWWFS